MVAAVHFRRWSAPVAGRVLGLVLACLAAVAGRADVANPDSAVVLIADTAITTVALGERGARVAVAIDLRSRAARTVTARVDTIVIDPHGHESGHLSQVVDLAPGEWTVARKDVQVANARPWSPANPVRYRAVTRVSVGGRAVDQVTTPFGLRTVRASPDGGLEFNGAPLPLFGVSLSRASLFGAIGGPAVEARRVTLLKEAGFNVVRVSGEVPDDFLEACDQLGLLVLMDLLDPDDLRAPGGDGVQAARGAMRRSETRVRQHRNRPSVLAWSVARGQREFPVPYREDLIGEWVARIHDLGPDLLVSGEVAVAVPGERLPPVSVIEVSGEAAPAVQRDVVRAGRVVFRFEPPGTDPFVAWRRAREPGVAASFTPAEDDFSLIGARRPSSWYREIVWGEGEALRVWTDPAAARHDTGTARNPAGSRGRSSVEVFSRYDSVRLYVDDRLVGEAPTLAAQAFKARFDLEDQGGSIRVVGLRRGLEIETVVLSPPGEPRGLRVRALTPELRADGVDTAFVEVTLVDADGQRVPESRPVRIQVLSGDVEAALLGEEEAAATGAATRLDAGRGVLLVRGTARTGPARLSIITPGLPSGAVELNVVPP